MTSHEVELYQPHPYPPAVVDQGGYQPAYPHPAYSYPGYPPPMVPPEMPADRLYYVNGVPHVKTATGSLVPLHPPRSHLHRNPVALGIVWLIAAGAGAAGLFVVVYALMEFVSWGMDHALKIGAALVFMVAISVWGLKALGTARHGHPMKR